MGARGWRFPAPSCTFQRLPAPSGTSGHLRAPSGTFGHLRGRWSKRVPVGSTFEHLRALSRTSEDFRGLPRTSEDDGSQECSWVAPSGAFGAHGRKGAQECRVVVLSRTLRQRSASRWARWAERDALSIAPHHAARGCGRKRSRGAAVMQGMRDQCSGRRHGGVHAFMSRNAGCGAPAWRRWTLRPPWTSGS